MATKRVGDPKSVIIIQAGQFGDMIATTPMFRAVKERYPNCEVTVVGKAINKEVLALNPDVDKFLVWDESQIKELVKELRRHSYDFGCVTGPNFIGLALLYLGKVRTIAAPIIKNGWSPYETKPYKMLSRLVLNKDHVMRTYVPREFLKLLEPIGVHTTNTKKYVYWTDEAEAKIGKIISAFPPYAWLIGIMPGAGNKIKQWPPERFAEVADYLIGKYQAYIVVIGSRVNREEIDGLLASVKNKDRIVDMSYTTVDEVKALVSKMDLTVSVDTGPVFIAEATNVPTVDIAGSIDPNEMAPNDGDKHLVVVSEGEPEIMTMNAHLIDHDKARRQIEAITVRQVLATVEELMSKIRP